MPVAGKKRKSLFYAVSNGRQIGIYTSWERAADQVYAFKHSVYKSYTTLAEALQAMRLKGYEDPPIFNDNIDGLLHTTTSRTEPIAPYTSASDSDLRFNVLFDGNINSESMGQDKRSVHVIEHDNDSYNVVHSPHQVHSDNEVVLSYQSPMYEMHHYAASHQEPDNQVHQTEVKSYFQVEKHGYLESDLSGSLPDLVSEENKSPGKPNPKIINYDSTCISTEIQCDLFLNSSPKLPNKCDTVNSSEPTATHSTTRANESSNSSDAYTQTEIDVTLTTSTTSSDASIQTDTLMLDEILTRLNARDELVEHLIHELNHVKLHIQNEIKVQVNSVLEENQVTNIKIADIRHTNDTLKSSIADQKNLMKDLLKVSTNIEKRCKNMDKDFEVLKERMNSLSSEIEEIQSQISIGNDVIQAEQPKESEKFSCDSHTSISQVPEAKPNNEKGHGANSDSSSYSSRIKTPAKHRNVNGQHNYDKPTPKDNLFTVNLNSEDYADSDCFIIGDSQISLIKPHKMNPTGCDDIITKISVPGITAYNLFEWLKAHNPLQGVNQVIIHVGANTCMKGDIVKREHWKYLIAECKRVFPGANIVMSSIIPVGSKNKFFPLIEASLNNLWKASQDLDVVLVDHTRDFLTPNNAPRLELFSKLLHPNLKGTGRMAKNLKYPFSLKNREEDNSSVNDYDYDTFTQSVSPPCSKQLDNNIKVNSNSVELSKTKLIEQFTEKFTEMFAKLLS